MWIFYAVGLLSLVVAYFTCRFVERNIHKYRFSDNFRIPRFLFLLFCALTLIPYVGAVITSLCCMLYVLGVLSEISESPYSDSHWLTRHVGGKVSSDQETEED